MKIAAKGGPLTILFSGHDLKFLQHVLAYYQIAPGYNVLVDEQEGHVIKDTGKSQRLLNSADIIFCEWCLGNAEWYSHNKREGQILMIRLHHQEIAQDLPYLNNINWENVNSIIFICQNNMSVFLDRFPCLKDRAVLIYNLIDCRSLNLPKLPGAEFNLGFIGTVPKRKAPHYALAILARLKAVDSRYTLFIKGKHPWEYKWLWNQADERQYYEKFYSDINQSEYANSIVFDPHGPDIPEWFSKIGFILSTSEHEGSHQAVAEGMAAGSIPVIRDWRGSDLLYPGEYVFQTVDDAVELIRKWNTFEYFVPQSEIVRSYAGEYFDKPVIIEQYRQLLHGLLLEQGCFNPDLLSGGEEFTDGELN